MASPVSEGSFISTAFSSHDIDIVYEKLGIKINPNLYTASFNVEYKIKTSQAGKQIPLLFYAARFKEGFHVWVDGVEIITENYQDPYRNLFDAFSENFVRREAGSSEMVEVDFGPRYNWLENKASNKQMYPLGDLKFFELDLSEGEHTIKVTYDALAWEDRSDWVKNYSFRYSLSPAQHWKSFGGLELTLDASAFNNPPILNIGAPQKGSLDSIAIWKFDSIPADFIIVTNVPKISNYAKTMIKIGPGGLALIWSLLLFCFHFLMMYIFRRKNSSVRFAWVMITGSILIPFFMLAGYPFTFSIIDSAIGPVAGGMQGYMSFMIIIVYPIVLVIYWVIMWLLDRLLRKRFRKDNL